MKRIFAIFSVIFALVAVAPQSGWGDARCEPFPCRHSDIGINEEYIYAYSNVTNWCFSCDSDDDSIGESECPFEKVVYQINSTNKRATNLYKCINKTGTSEDEWIDNNPPDMCSYSELDADADIANAETFYGKVGSETSFDRPGIVDDISKWCKYYKCKPDFIKSPDRKSCIPKTDATRAERTCRDSGGKWNGEKCLCGPDDRGDGKGEGQTYDIPDKSCKCANPAFNWDETAGKCVDPDAADAENCRNSHGEWVDGRCTCDEDLGLEVSGKICKCKNYPSELWNGTRCDASPESVCTGSGGEWDDDACDCDIEAKHIKKKDGSDPVRCVCESDDYEWVTGKENLNGCKLSAAAENRMDTFEKLKKACERDWGGTWSGSKTDNPDTWECVCDADAGKTQTYDKKSCMCNDAAGYVQVSMEAPYKCKKTSYAELKDNCEAAKGAGALVRWVETPGYCECRDPNKKYIFGLKSCIDKNANTVEWCSLIKGARMSVDGKGCVCVATKRPPVDGKCPTTTSNQSQSPVVDTTNAKKEISKIADELDGISDAWGRSRWKNASGGFNTARLASDSIAGVVLGTVGGVVTSNIIKKNQVKGGFEDINCNIGGQRVANFGDQFQVGIH